MDELLAFRKRKHKNKLNTENKAKPCTHKSQNAYINRYNELVICFKADNRYHYWNGGMSILDILRELCASEEIIGKYVEQRRVQDEKK